MKKITFLVLSLVGALALFAAIVLNIMTIINSVNSTDIDLKLYINSFTFVVVATVGIYYILCECKKETGANYFKLFMALCALSQIAILFGAEEYHFLNTMLITVQFGAFLVLAMGKDLGKIKSYGLALAVVVCTVAQLIVFFVADSDLLISTIISSLILAACSLFMIFAKYYDKSLRGSK